MADADTTFLNNKGDTVSSLAECYKFTTVELAKGDPIHYIIRNYYQDGTLHRYGQYLDAEGELLDGIYRSYYRDGLLRSESQFVDDKRQGYRKTYWKNGQIRRHDTFDEGSFQSGSCFDSLGNEVPYYDMEIQPEYPGGMQALLTYIGKETEYPAKARKKEITGKVLVKFIVNKDGSPSDFELVKEAHPLLNEEALRVAKGMKDWSPGFQDGVPVRVTMVIPFNFKMRD